jgi:predicted ATP-binding protein involved in virulence
MKRLWEYGQSLPAIDSEGIDFKELPAVCLIDEIDTYLHPDWQYSILKGLVDSFPNVQFIITSHSPFVLTSVPSHKITIYDLHTEGGEIVVREILENLSGADANRATDKISSHRSKRPFKLFSLLQNKIDNNQLDEAEQILNQLIEDEKVDENRDLEILRAKRLIRTKKLLQSTKPATL